MLFFFFPNIEPVLGLSHEMTNIFNLVGHLHCSVCRVYVGKTMFKQYFVHRYRVFRVDPMKCINFCEPSDDYTKPHGHNRIIINVDRELDTNLCSKSLETYRGLNNVSAACKFSSFPRINSGFEPESGATTRPQKYSIKKVAKQQVVEFISRFERAILSCSANIVSIDFVMKTICKIRDEFYETIFADQRKKRKPKLMYSGLRTYRHVSFEFSWFFSGAFDDVLRGQG